MIAYIQQIKPIESFASENDSIAVFCGNPHKDQFHCGILYKYNSIPYILHLANHKSLLNDNFDTFNTEKCVWVKSKITPRIQIQISACCRNIIYRDNFQNIPYGLYYKDSRFDKDGILSLGNDEIGLTCATFVLSIFSSCNATLVDVENWPVRDDDNVWHDYIIALLTQYKVELHISDEHLTNMTNEKYCARFRPEEVTASSTFFPHPDSFVNISSRGALLRSVIKNM